MPGQRGRRRRGNIPVSALRAAGETGSAARPGCDYERKRRSSGFGHAEIDYFALGALFFDAAQVLALKHSTTPSMILPNPSRKLASSTMSLLLTASVTDNAALANDMAADFLSAPLLLPESASMPCTMAGINAIPLSNFDRKFILFSCLFF